MKKILILILILAVILSFVSCGEKENNDSFDDQNIEVSEKTQAELFDESIEALSLIKLENSEIVNQGLLAPAQKEAGGKYGYIDAEGNWVIEPKYITASYFSEGCAIVLDEYNEYCLINTSGEVILDTYKNTYAIEGVSYSSKGFIPLMIDTTTVQKSFYLSTDLLREYKANILSGIKFPRKYASSLYFSLATPFSIDGIALVMKLKNSEVSSGEKNESAYVIDIEGNVTATLPEGLDPDEFGFDDQANVIVSNEDSLYGICDKDGNLVVECKYKRLAHCDGPLYLVCNDNGFFGYINAEDELIVDYKYQKAMPFSEGYAAVYNGSYWGFIDESGEVVCDFIFEDVAGLKLSNIASNLNKGAFSEGVAGVLRNGYWVLVDKTFTPIASMPVSSYTNLSGSVYKLAYNGLVIFEGIGEYGSAYGVLDNQGKLVINPSFADIGIFN